MEVIAMEMVDVAVVIVTTIVEIVIEMIVGMVDETGSATRLANENDLVIEETGVVVHEVETEIVDVRLIATIESAVARLLPDVVIHAHSVVLLVEIDANVL